MKVALIGNPNCGKTSLFNKLTGSNQKIGNWPGVTIEKKEGRILNSDIEIVDLPGTYSLFPYTEEERVSRDYLLNGEVDVVVNVVDSTALERSLYLTTQLFELGVKVVLALNMTDLLRDKGMDLDEKNLSSKLGFPAIKVSAKTGLGLKELVGEITNQKTQKQAKYLEFYSLFIEKELKNIEKEANFGSRFLTIERLIDEKYNKENKSVERLKTLVEKIYGSDVVQVLTSQKYDFISETSKECFKQKNNKTSISDRLDKIFLNKWLSIPIFVLIMTLVYVLSVGVVGKITTDALGSSVSKLSESVEMFLAQKRASKWAISLVVNGLISGIGSVLLFVPQLVSIFLCVSILETTGYMSRISFVFDRLFRRFGLSGKSLIPFIVGTGCSVPAISLSKTIENSGERQMSVILTPFVPCSAKLPIISLFAGYFFPRFCGLVTALLYFLAIIVIIICALILKRFVFRDRVESFVLELPEYKKPSIKYTARDVFDKTKEFVSRAGTIIVFCSIIVWFLSSFNWKFQYTQNTNASILAWIGNLFAWFFYPIVGEWNWAISVSAIQGIIAKEQVVSSMSVIAGISDSGVGSQIFSSEVFCGIGAIGAFAFVVFNLFSAPCVASIGAMKTELKSTKKTIFAVLFQIGFAWVISSLIFCLGSLF